MLVAELDRKEAAVPALAGGGGPEADDAMRDDPMDAKHAVKTTLHQKSRQTSVAASVRPKVRESARHFRKWLDHRYDFDPVVLQREERS
eukprot:6899529-Alexandrium_andersonii.AAC.1